MKRVSLVLVAHRSSSVIAAAVESFRSAAAYAAVIGEVVIVDHSEDEKELEAARASGADRVVAKRNRGYAAGVNVGISEATGDIILVGNADIRLERPALAPLLNALDAGYHLVGPLFTLAGFLLPPADVQRPGAERRRLRASRLAQARRRHLQREVRYWRSVWDAEEPVAVRSLSGALIAFPRKIAYHLGPWDEEYFLYFEESDWCLRAEREGLRMGQVPASRVEHRWGHSADPVAMAEVFAKARKRFYSKNFRLGSFVADGGVEETASSEPPEFAGEVDEDEQLLWLASPLLHGFPAAGAYIRGNPSTELEGLLAAANVNRATVTCMDPRTQRLHGPWSFRTRPSRRVEKST